MNEEKKAVMLYDIKLEGTPITINNTFRNQRHLNAAESIIKKIVGLKKEYDDFMRGLER
jgi:hypothetical protein